METFRNQSKQVLELVRDVPAGMIPGAVAEPFGLMTVFPEALGLPFFHNPPDLPAAGIVFNADTHVPEPFPIQESELLAGEFAGPVEDVLGFGEAEVVVSVLHEQVVFIGLNKAHG